MRHWVHNFSVISKERKDSTYERIPWNLAALFARDLIYLIMVDCGWTANLETAMKNLFSAGDELTGFEGAAPGAFTQG